VNESGEKRFDATPARRERARRDGNSARSAELSGIAAFAAAAGALAAVLPWLAHTAAQAVRAAARAPLTIDARVAIPVLAFAVVPALAAAIAAVGVTFAQTGGLRPAPLRLAFAKLAPHTGLKRMVGGEAAVGAARALVALIVTLAVVVPVVAHVMAAALRAPTPLDAARATRDGAFAACAAACLTGALFAGADYALVVRRWLRSLKMTFDDFKRDMKEQDGDPHARSRRRQLHRTLARGGVARTREASFVVVNPTHIAIALRYAPPAVPVPQILVRAVDDAALAVRALAERAAIPVVENVALARLLFRVGDAGEAIPTETFVAVAEVIAALVRAGALDV
jgi:flagellar biosynthesis protein FlhB